MTRCAAHATTADNRLCSWAGSMPSRSRILRFSAVELHSSSAVRKKSRHGYLTRVGKHCAHRLIVTECAFCFCQSETKVSRNTAKEVCRLLKEIQNCDAFRQLPGASQIRH